MKGISRYLTTFIKAGSEYVENEELECVRAQTIASLEMERGYMHRGMKRQMLAGTL